MTFKKAMALVAMAFLWTGSQIPLYLYGGVPPYIYGELGGVERWTWFVLANLFALGATCPFVGSLSDLFGRRWVAIGGATLLVIGNIVCATAHTMNIFIGGMAIAGVGAGINELTSLAVTAELAPTRKRGLYVSILVFTIVPFCPSVLWAQLISSYGSWRWIGLLCGLWGFIGLVMTAVFYHPPPRDATVGLSKKEVLTRIDWYYLVGGFLSIGGFLSFMMALQWGGYQYAWTSPHVLVCLIVGAVLIIAFGIYEKFFVKYPMFPGAIAKEPRILLLTLVITFISGSNFFSVLMFWPTQSYNVYGHDPWSVGKRNLCLGFPILAGACIGLALLSWTKGRIREIMLVSSIVMTAGGGGFAALNRDNIWLSYILLIISGLGIGGIVVPASIISTIICPDELIATVAALTLSIRVLGGATGYAIYFNVFSQKFVTNSIKYLGTACVELGITDPEEIKAVIGLTATGLLPALKTLPGINTPEAYDKIVYAGQLAYAESYPWVYYVSLAFGSLSIICSIFLGDIRKYMTDHVAVHMDQVPEGHHHIHHDHKG
ncbi:MFS general substrate transporter [Pleomassaria siparia CBS 279.74]|uniref:MFS general substrate transporter n=1 Tax=Pleomassaria siparia CBS 279.74 TaxID=1314801 RepID=A0A6G1JX57_9PLEO|nr:MFS general substrate transporter [Pleomassaria siparia CBS 279.74]